MSNHVLIFDDEIPVIVEEYVRCACLPLEVHSFGCMEDCMQKYRELVEQKEKIVALIMEPILWFYSTTSSENFAQFFIEKGVPVICYTTGATVFMALAGKEDVVATCMKAGSIKKIYKGDSEELGNTLHQLMQ